MSYQQIKDDLDDLKHRVILLEQENEELHSELEAVSNELAYVDAYQDNQAMELEDLVCAVDEIQEDQEYLEAYMFNIENSVNDIAEVVFDNE